MEIEKYVHDLVMLDLSTKNKMNRLILNIQRQIKAEIANNIDINDRRPDYNQIIIFMHKQIQLLEFIRNTKFEKDIIDIDEEEITSLFDNLEIN